MSLPELNNSEIEVMNVLWTSGPLSAREIHASIPARLGWAYSTTRTVLNRLVDKGLVGKRPVHGLHVYRARITRAKGIASRVKHFAERVALTDIAPVVALFADQSTLDDDEVRELQRLLDLEQDQ